MTVTSWSVTSPVFVTRITKVAVPPYATVCEFGFFRMLIAGSVGVGFGVGFGVGGVGGGVSGCTVT